MPLSDDVRAEIELQLREQLLALVADNRDVVLDYSFWSRRMRDEYRSLLRGVSIEPETIYLATSREEVLERLRVRNSSDPDQLPLDGVVAAGYFDHFEPPTPDEGPLTVFG